MIWNFAKWLTLVPASILLYLISHIIILAAGRFIAWLSQNDEILKITEYLVAPVICAHMAFVFPLKMFPFTAKLPTIVLSSILLCILGAALGFAMYGLSRNSALACLFSAAVIMFTSYRRLLTINWVLAGFEDNSS